MKHYTKSIISLLLLIVALSVFLLVPTEHRVGLSRYGSPELGLTFTYPEHYFIPFEMLGVGERRQWTIILAEATPENRAFFEHPPAGTEAPPVITITAFQNTIDGYTADRFIEQHPEANGSLSYGVRTKVVVGGDDGLRYRSTGLYENEHVVVARSNYVFLFTVAFNEQDAPIRGVFDQIVNSAMFGESMNPPTSADGAKPGSIHNLPVPAAVDAARKHAAQETRAPQSAIITLKVADREWPDGCLGLGGSGEMCTQAIVPGFEVTVQVYGETRIYRTNANGTIIRRDEKHA